MSTWDDRFRGGDYTTLDPHPLVEQWIQGLPPGDALDLACGAGRHSVLLSSRGWRVTAVDVSPVGLDILRSRAPEVTAIQADLERHEFAIPASAFDLVVCCLYFQRDLLPAIRASLRPGARAILIAKANSRFSPNPGELEAAMEGLEILASEPDGQIIACVAQAPR